MATFSITNVNDWYTAIGDSHQATPSYTTYLLTTSLTFTSTNPPFLTSTTTPSGSNGALDTDYLYITAGQTFNGQGYLITLNNGCQPTNGMAGIFRTVGVSGNTANIKYINISGASGLPWDVNGYGCIFIGSFFHTYDPNYVNIQYGIINASTNTNVSPTASPAKYTTWVINFSNNLGNMSIDSLYMYLNGNILGAGSFLPPFGVLNGAYPGYDGNCSITNCVFYCNDIIGAFAKGGAGSLAPLLIQNCYFYSANQSISSQGAYIIGQSYSETTITNVYVQLSTYSSSSTFSSDVIFLGTSQSETSTTTLTNFYTNNTSINSPSAIIIGTPVTSYLFPSPGPTFSSPNGFEAWTSGPNLLTVFKSYPFNSSVYTTFDISPAFLAPPICFNSGTVILCYGPMEDTWKPVESLKKGDLVKTYLHGYRRIDTIISSEIENNANSLFECMYRLPKTKDMMEDLIVTGGHSIMEDELPEKVLEMYEMNNWFDGGKDSMIDGKYMVLACLSDKFEKVMTEEKFQIYHFALENDGEDTKRYLVWANHVLTETPSKAYLQIEKV
jgi:hypothetical protein